MSTIMRIVFVDDDPDEIDAFIDLTKGSSFEVVAVCAQTPGEALDAVAKAVGKNIPCLFVLDLYFPKSGDSPTGFRDLTAAREREVWRPVSELSEAVGQLERAFHDHPDKGKMLLREANEVTRAARRVLDTWCWHLDQSPRGGLELLRNLRESSLFAEIPAVFYSRKATLRDAKDALEKGALDVISKLDRRATKDDKRNLLRMFEAYCRRDECADREPRDRRSVS